MVSEPCLWHAPRMICFPRAASLAQTLATTSASDGDSSLTIAKLSSTDNETTSTFVSEKAVYPDANRFQGSKIFNVTWVPLYAKMSWLDRKIIYFDMGLQLGYGQTEYQIIRDSGNETKNGSTTSLSLMQHFFFSSGSLCESISPIPGPMRAELATIAQPPWGTAVSHPEHSMIRA